MLAKGGVNPTIRYRYVESESARCGSERPAVELGEARRAVVLGSEELGVQRAVPRRERTKPQSASRQRRATKPAVRCPVNSKAAANPVS